MRIVPDTSVIVDGRITEIVQKKKFKGSKVIVPAAVVSELEYQANRGRESGFNGLEELKNLQKLHKKGEISLTFAGKRPSLEEITLSRGGEIDAMIRDIAKKHNGILVTSDRVQAKVAEAQGLEVIYIKPQVLDYKKLEIMKYFDENTMSVHLKENVVPMAKKGKIGNIKLVKIGSKPLNRSELSKMAREIIEAAKSDLKSFIEIEREGATVVQFREYRISIARPPFSEAYEITAVRPVAKVSLEDYKLPNKLIKRLKDVARGILIAGPPGAGKSTFAQAIAEFYKEEMNSVVKTMESPRDLQVSDEITQYAPLERDMQKTADILLLVRPDFTIYDEMRKTKDFKIFADMRLAGVGMIGVVHATRPIDAIQRVIGRVELGMIPSIIDTTIFIKDGKVETVYDISLTVKVPTGMTEEDLARPVIEVRDFETNELVYEIYTYGEQTVVMDVSKISAPKKAPVRTLAEKEIEREFKKRFPHVDVKVKMESDNRAKVWVNEKYIPQIIGKKGRTIEKIEEKLGISISVEPLVEKKKEKEITVDVNDNHIVLNFGTEDVGKSYDIFVDNEYLFTATVGKRGTIKVRRDIDLAKVIEKAIETNLPITAKPRD
ncbi:ATPase, PilT family [Methanothermus fervidus DSM 2088]|uniref:ATPase, PilT family n=1 Tax=Methanothermus fervidus (strain ATCC 43054 / DSM 2088 / JCM 10308 / V24 S) TaxID=523846 RepID=E3GWQ8_METFV|nr:PINc/VapC family ATPase [Methanothermus fervidus]ADP77977.1 ATPase, PilT family [Methanothermus fervidus DSM 2088]